MWTGVQWRSLDSKYPPWQSVYYYFNKWAKTGIFEQILDELVVKERQRQHKENTPSLLAIDSQSVKKVTFISQDTGIDGGKFVNGRKRHIFVDTLGLPWATYVTAANISDSEAGCLLSDQLKGKVPRLKVITADQGYKVTFIEHIKVNYKWTVEIGQKPESTKGFVPQKNRWQVERSFAWLNFRRRLAKDYEKTIDSSEAVLRLAYISFILPKVAK